MTTPARRVWRGCSPFFRRSDQQRGWHEGEVVSSLLVFRKKVVRRYTSKSIVMEDSSGPHHCRARGELWASFSCCLICSGKSAGQRPVSDDVTDKNHRRLSCEHFSTRMEEQQTANINMFKYLSSYKTNEGKKTCKKRYNSCR